MLEDFSHATLGRTGLRTFRLGLSASYWPGRATLHRALDEGVNYFFCYGFDYQMIRTLRGVLPRERERYVVATGAYNFVWARQNLRRTLEKRLRQLRTEYIDLFHFLGVMKPSQFDARVQEELAALRDTGLVRGVSLSCHDRRFAGELAARGVTDALMIRYNAAHRGAEQEIFPRLEPHRPAVVSYTATRWRYLLRRPRGWAGRVPDAGMCYRFVLSNPAVDVCMTAPSNPKQFEANLAAVRRGPLAEDELAFMREFGDVVHQRAGWFM